MTQRDAAASLQACAFRVARLASDGTTPAGATNGYLLASDRTKVAKLTRTPNKLAGQNFTERDSCGGLSTPYQERDLTQWYDLELEIMTPDPELEEMLTAAALLTGTYQAARSVTDAAITSGSPTLTSATGNFTAYDVGATLSGPAGIPGATTILAVVSATQVTMSANATATASAQSVTITPATATLGVVAPALGVVPSDAGVSMEIWTKAMIGPNQASKLPWFHWAFPKTQWSLGGTVSFENGVQHTVFQGRAYENPLWGNGPWNDWMGTAPSVASLSAAWGRYRSNDFPTLGTFSGYVTVPAQA